MRTAVIVDAIRSPMAKGRANGDRPGGALSTLHPVELLSQVLAKLFERNDVDPGSVDDVITGCVSQAGEQAGPIGRWAWLAAGFPEHVPSVNVHRACGSSQQAADFGAQGVISGVYDIVVAAGVESMSRVPMLAGLIGQDAYGPSLTARYEPGLIPQGVAADLIAARWGIGREELDAFSARSHTLSTQADFSRELVPIRLENGELVIADETIRPGTTPAGLSALQPVFRRSIGQLPLAIPHSWLMARPLSSS